MKKTTFLFFFVFSICTVFSQETTVDTPISWGIENNDDATTINLPPLDLLALHREDSINDRDKSLPWRYGIKRNLKIDVHKDGTVTQLDNGDKLWRIAISSPNAVNLSLNFGDFYIPNGAKLFLYNDDKTDVLLPLTTNQNRNNQQLGSWFINGDKIWLEYYEPESVNEEVLLNIKSIIHGYRMGKVERYMDGTRGLNDSGDCNYDVNCPIGEDFDSQKDILKKAVALLNLGNGYLCSAVLINNTNKDKKPYLLTGNHCLDNSDPAFWSVRFNWMSPSPVCGEDKLSPDLQTNFTMSGAELKAANNISDFALVELYNSIPSSWDVAFAGWDITDELPLYEIGIHHPNGDIMKICRDNSGAIHETANGTEVWLIGGASVGEGNGWEIGTTESGSSGSPLFNQNGKIIGQLYAGNSSCDGLENNNKYDIYGRLAVSWDTGSTSNKRLKEWLDPNETGQTQLETTQNLLNVPDFDITGELKIYPNPASETITIMNSRYPNLSYHFYSITGQQISQGSVSSTMNTISVAQTAEGMYFLQLTDLDSNSSITKKIIVSR
ncbi:T9SS type A sorting domain-containing protein [Marixanthomonas ophiurae]|uniref:T9SS C-terminal target domain-containing protein n=1 Tax=Marixanthomonas ophiurae TaxID=387659 RepID=A0A3E1QCB4_9FLAO|nr:T9SS type A sorting domain-containing protein [Marixanthomonas ophiurae]RFN59768.1 T9SS C-terminal target domain-containing protein [Marixanthomonas ophiurae]